MKWIGQHIFDSIAKFRNTVDFSEDVTFYQPINDGNPIIQIGSSDTECLQLVASYDSGTKGMDFIEIRTKTASGTANKAMIKILVDDVT